MVVVGVVIAIEVVAVGVRVMVLVQILLGLYWGCIQIMEKKMETFGLYRGICWCSIGIMENTM